jgi:ubiquinone/menaquinone biosynthesis C-methylase UbiE
MRSGREYHFISLRAKGMNSPSFNIMNNLYIPVGGGAENDLEQQDILLRQKEQRIYTDKELLLLPEVARGHPHFDEWLMRKRSCRQLMRHLESRKYILNILDVKCGNGWLSYQLSRIPGSRVIGLDTGLTELQQAARVFNSNSKLKFIFGDIRTGLVSDLKFDVIVMADFLQYFHDLHEVIGLSLKLLNQNGEIHILNSPFYKPGDIEAAKKKTMSYYTQLGLPEMASRHHHHSITEIKVYNHRILHNPSSIKNKLRRNNNPFPWICIRNDLFL